MKGDRLPNIVLFGQPSRAKRKVGRPRIRLEEVVKKNLAESSTSGYDFCGEPFCAKKGFSFVKFY